MSASSPRRKIKKRSEESGELEEESALPRADARERDDEDSLRAHDDDAPRVRDGDCPPAHGEDATEEKPLRYIIQNLERAYGVPANRRPANADPLDVLVATILSQATSDTNSDRTFAALKKRFPTWDAVLRARVSTLADTIRAGGLANQKAAVIRALLRQLRDERGSLDLSFLHDLPAEEAVSYLSRFRGIGPKTVACTLLFACRKDVFPLDTHIFRILRRLGLLPRKCTDARAHALLNALVPDGKFYSFHVNLIRHGRRLCRPRDPLCERCPIVEYCDYGQQVI